MKTHAIFFCVLQFLLVPALLFAGVINYQYDDLGRVTAANYDDGAGSVFGYDAVGNRLSATQTSAPDTGIVYEDAEDGTTEGWDIYDDDPAGATIANVEDTDRGSRVIEFTGSGAANGYRLRNPDGTRWNNGAHKVIQWSLKYSENYTIFIAVQTTDGFRYIYYNKLDYDNLGSDKYIHHGLGSSSRDGSWHTFTRDLEHDLHDAQPDNDLVAILGFLIRGSGRVDDIKTLASYPADLDSDGDGLTDLDEINIYATSPSRRDTDNDGIADQEEITYWGSAWNEDPDNDGIINLLDEDSDNDGLSDGVEVEQGTNPADAGSISSSLVYEDAEAGTTTGWDIYDDDPAGATIANVEDTDRGSRVIEFTGSGAANGYRLRNPDGTRWNNGAHKVIQWSMKYSENFTVYVAVQTTDGFRYIYYNKLDYDNLGSDKYIHHGLSAGSRDGNWHTLTRDLEHDLHDAQPDNNLVSILGFLIRGSGRVDDIKTLASYPADLDSDNDGLTDLDEMNTYGTNPYRPDTDMDGLDDGIEITYWGSSWNEDADNDGIINLLDVDSDNDGIDDGTEVSLGTDPADAASVSSFLVYEDAEAGTTTGWDVYDDDPAGAAIANVDDPDRGSRVIEFSGSGASNGYRLRNPDGSWWNNSTHKVIQWSMKYSENYTVYIAVQTTDGFRYIYYNKIDYDNLGSDKYIHHGLGSSSRDGSWHTFTRDLEQDLHDAQPDNDLVAILGFLIRGSGRVDDIKTLASYPAD